MATYAHTFTSGETVTPTKLNNARTVSDIVNADIKSDAAIAASKLANTLDLSTKTVTLPDGNIATAKIADAAVTAAKLAYDNGPTGGFRNRIINGNFDIWQRGTSFATDGYGADRWYNAVTGSSCTMSRQDFALGQTDVPNQPTHFCRMSVTSSAGAGNSVIAAQLIEDVRTLSGQAATVSFYAKADSSKSIALELRQDFGSGGSPSSAVTTIGAQKFSLTTSWQKFTATISIPSIAGKTLGTNNNSRLELLLWFDAGSNFNSRTDSLGQQSGTFDIAQVQVEQGSKATPFEARPIGTELALCQRYYEKSYNVDVAPNTNTTVGAEFTEGRNDINQILGTFAFSTRKRATPTVTVIGTTGTSGNVRNTTAGTNHAALTLGLGSRGLGVYLDNSAVATGNDIGFHWTANAEL